MGCHICILKVFIPPQASSTTSWRAAKSPMFTRGAPLGLRVINALIAAPSGLGLAAGCVSNSLKASWLLSYSTS